MIARRGRGIIGPLSKDRGRRFDRMSGTSPHARWTPGVTLEDLSAEAQPTPDGTPASGEAPQPRVVSPVSETAPGWQVWTALWIVYIVWGSTYLAIRVVDRTMPALLSSGVRFLIAGAIVCTVLALRRGLGAVRVSARQLLACTVVGSLLVTGGNGLVMIGEEHVASGIAALIIASVPLWVVLYRAVTGESIARGTLLGVALGFAGVALLFLPGGAVHGSLGGYVAVLIAAPCWALGTFLSPRLALPRNPFLSTGVQMIAGGVTSILAGLARGEAGSVHVDRFSSDSLLAFAYLVVVGSLIAFTAYVWVLQHAPVSKVSTYAFVNPVIAVFLGWLILGESVTLAIVAGAAVIVASVALIVRKEAH
jgi:drug/metabolite transporter (DMT)-like permease